MARIRKAREMSARVQPRRAAPAYLRVTGSLLKKYLSKAAGTACGADQWSASQMCDLPEEALDELAVIWNLSMDTGSFPQAWLEVRTVTIPKPEGGYRGLSIAAQSWRACMSATLYLSGDWADGVAAE